MVLRMLDYSTQDRKIRSEQISLILGKNYVLSFQEFEGGADASDYAYEREGIRRKGRDAPVRRRAPQCFPLSFSSPAGAPMAGSRRPFRAASQQSRRFVV